MSEAPLDPPADLSAMLTRVMSDPAAMGMLSSLLGGLRAGAPKEESHGAKEKCEAPIVCGTGARDKDRKALLLALKPFLSAERRQALDRIIMVSEALSLLRSEKRD